MSDTPETDAAVKARKQDAEVDLVPASLARKLENKLADSQRDTARLDWVQRLVDKQHLVCFTFNPGADVRKGIDDEMEKQQPTETDATLAVLAALVPLDAPPRSRTQK